MCLQEIHKKQTGSTKHLFHCLFLTKIHLLWKQSNDKAKAESRLGGDMKLENHVGRGCLGAKAKRDALGKEERMSVWGIQIRLVEIENVKTLPFFYQDVSFEGTGEVSQTWFPWICDRRHWRRAPRNQTDRKHAMEKLRFYAGQRWKFPRNLLKCGGHFLAWGRWQCYLNQAGIVPTSTLP